MITWWAHLSWSRASLLLLAIALLLGFLFWRRASKPRPMATPTHPRPYVVDYSLQYRQKVEWLGDRFLLAKSINRKITP